MTQMFLEVGPGVNALILAGQEERVDHSKVGHSITLQHGIIKNRSNGLCQLRKLSFCWENLAHTDVWDKLETYDSIWEGK